MLTRTRLCEGGSELAGSFFLVEQKLKIARDRYAGNIECWRRLLYAEKASILQYEGKKKDSDKSNGSLCMLLKWVHNLMEILTVMSRKKCQLRLTSVTDCYQRINLQGDFQLVKDNIG
jgi:hypothetical protein